MNTLRSWLRYNTIKDPNRRFTAKLLHPARVLNKKINYDCAYDVSGATTEIENDKLKRQRLPPKEELKRW